MTSSEWGPNLQVIRAVIITGDGLKKNLYTLWAGFKLLTGACNIKITPPTPREIYPVWIGAPSCTKEDNVGWLLHQVGIWLLHWLFQKVSKIDNDLVTMQNPLCEQNLHAPATKAAFKWNSFTVRPQIQVAASCYLTRTDNPDNL